MFFIVNYDGTVLTNVVGQSSGDPAFDQSALNAVQLSTPLPAPPATAQGNLKVVVTIDERFADPAQVAENLLRYEHKQQQKQQLQTVQRMQQQAPPVNEEIAASTLRQPPPEMAPTPQTMEFSQMSDADLQAIANAGSASRNQQDDTEASTLSDEPRRDLSNFKLMRMQQLSRLSVEERELYSQQLGEWFALPPERRLKRFCAARAHAAQPISKARRKTR